MFSKKLVSALIAGSMIFGTSAAVAQTAAPAPAVETVAGDSALVGENAAPVAVAFVLVAFFLAIWADDLFGDEDAESP